MANKMEVKTEVVVTEGKSSSGYKKYVENAKTMEQTTKGTKENAENIKKALITAFNKSAVVGWAKIIKDTVNGMLKASEKQTEYIENLNLMQVAFKDSADSALNYVDTISNAFGFDQSNITRQLGIFRQISSAMQYTSDVADLLSTNLSKLSIDIASLYNVNIERAGKSLESAITGQVRSIRSLTGADITLATLQQEAYARGIEKSTREMTRAEKTILIYLSLERQLANANGDMARTINSVANQTKIFHDQIYTLGRNLGGFLIPILKTLLPILNGILMAINAIISSLLSLFGIDATKLSTEFGITSAGLDLMEDGLEGISNAASKAKKSLRGFDKLNNITTPTASGYSGGAGGGGLGNVDSRLLEALKEYDLHLDKMRNKAAEIRDLILEWLGFSKDVNGQWKWGLDTLLTNVWKSWSKLNLAGKVFVALGIVKVITGIYNGFKKLATLLKTTKLVSSLSNIADVLGKKGIKGAIEDLNKSNSMAAFIEGLIGVIATVDGLMKVSNAMKDIEESGKSWQSIVDIIVGVTEAIGGLVLAFGAITGNAGAIAAGFGIIGGAIGVDLIAKIFDTRTELEKLEDKLNSEIWEDLAMYKGVQNLSTELENYIGQNGRVQESDEQRVDFILNKLNEAYGTEYELIDGLIYNNGELVTSYQDVEKEIDKYMAKIKAQMILEKYQAAYTDALIKQEERQKLVNKADEEYEKKKKDIIELEKQLIDAGFDREEVSKRIKELNEEADKEHETSLGKINDKYKEYIDLIKQYDQLEQDMYTGNIEGIKKTTEEMIGSQAKVSEKALKDIEKSYSKIDSQFNKIATDIINSGYSLGKDTAGQINKGMDDYLKTRYNINVSANGNYSTGIQGKAEGGFVKSGDIFMANENNRPEYIGSFGHQTAVANTDQIVDGIAIGVTKAMVATGANKESKVIIDARGDASGLLDFITFEQRKKDRQYGL